MRHFFSHKFRRGIRQVWLQHSIAHCQCQSVTVAAGSQTMVFYNGPPQHFSASLCWSVTKWMCSLPSHPEICKATTVWFGKRCLRVQLRYHKRVCEQLWLKKNLNNDSNASLKRSGDYDTLREVMNSSCAQKFQSVTQEPFRKERTSPRQETQLMINTRLEQRLPFLYRKVPLDFIWSSRGSFF